MTQEVERVDSIPLIIHWLLKMRVVEIIDHVLPHPHPNREGLSYGQLALLFLTYILYLRTHRLSGTEEWVVDHRHVLEGCTGWAIGPKEATDDRLGDLLTVLGEDVERGYTLQHDMSQHLIRAYALPTDVARYDTSTFSVQHAPGEDGTAAQGVLARGYSKDKRPNLVQFKQGVGTLDPAGVPILTDTVAGNRADDPLYVPAWRAMVETMGHPHFLFVADCKAGALETRAEIDHAGGSYLFPLPMTGKVPETLRAAVLNPPLEPQPITLVDVTTSDGQPKEVGRGFEIEHEMTATLEDGTSHTWTERWLITQSDAHAARQQKRLRQRLEKVETQLRKLKPKQDETAAELLSRAEVLVKRYKLADVITVQVHESVTREKRYIGRGRPGPNRPFEMFEVQHLQVTFERDEAAVADRLALAGWRIYVTNVPADRLCLDQAITYYRGEWLVERGFHRFKRGSLPTLPLYLRLPERIRGLMLLLLIALQALTLMEYVAQRELAERGETLAGLVPGNPKMQTPRPSAERLLARFDNLHLLIQRTETHIVGEVVETLTPLQRRILDLLGVPTTIYEIAFRIPLPNYRLYHNFTERGESYRKSSFVSRSSRFIQAVGEALEVGELDQHANLGAIFVESIKKLAHEAEVDLGFAGSVSGESVLDLEPDGESKIIRPEDNEELSGDVDDWTADDVWQEALADLQLQMGRSTFEAWLYRTRGVAWDGDRLVVELRNAQALDWVEKRIHPKVVRSVRDVVGHEVEVSYECRPASG